MLAQDFLIKEDNCIERLILAAGRYATMASPAREESFQFLFARKRIGHAVQGSHVFAQPIDITGFSREGFMLATQYASQPFNGKGHVHNESRESQMPLDKGCPMETLPNQWRRRDFLWINGPAVVYQRRFC